MSIISKQDTNGVKPLLLTGELGYDNYPAGGDVGRVFVGTGTENIGLAKRSEVVAVDSKADAHIARVDNPHGVTKAQVGLGNADNTADVDKSVLSATKLTTPRNITISGEVTGSASFDGSTDINISTTIQPNSVALGTDTTGNYVDSVIAGEGITVTGVVGEGWTPSIAIAPVGTSGTYTKVSTNDKGQVVSGELLTANDIPNLDASKITSGIIDAARLPASAGNIPEYATLSEFPIVGDSGKVYIALDTNKMYRWSGSTYVSIAGGVDSVAGKTGAVSLDKGDVGLTNVDNTSDINKPISIATQTALDLKANAANAALTGVPTAPTASVGTNTTQLATTAFVNAAITDSAPTKTGTGASGTWGINITGNSASTTKLATARTINGVSFDGTANITVADSTKAPLVSPALTGTPTSTTATDGTNNTQIATTAFVQNAVGGYLSKAITGGTVTLTDAEASNPVIAFSGALTSAAVIVVPTTTKRIWAIYNATSGAFTLTVKTAAGNGVTVAQGKRNLVYTDGSHVYDAFNDYESIALTGVTTAPTAAVGTNTSQIATTAFVRSIIPAGVILMWSGSIASIPAGWALCNGANGTPNLQDRFVIGAGSAYAVGATGGSKDAIVVSHTHTQAAHSHTFTTDESGVHSHTASTDSAGAHTHTADHITSGVLFMGTTVSNLSHAVTSTSSSGAHTHTVSVGNSAAHTHTGTTTTVTPTINAAGSAGTNANLPPYYALAYIMKL